MYFIVVLLFVHNSWAQAVVGAFEASLRRANKYTGPLSVQQILDCARGAP
jgi:hypothetical protein